MLRFIDDAHAAAADFTQDAEIAQRPRMVPGTFRRRFLGRGLQHLQRRQNLPQERRRFRMAGRIIFDARLLAAMHSLHELIDHVGHQGIQGTAASFGSVVHER